MLTSFSCFSQTHSEIFLSVLEWILFKKRKSARPLSTKKPIHLILKSSHSGLFNPGNLKLERLIRTQAQKFHLRLYDIALNWTHIHLLFRAKDRKNYHKFIRSLTSALAIAIRKFMPELEEIFSLRPFTRGPWIGGKISRESWII